MKIIYHNIDSEKVAEVISDEIIINGVQDALDLMVNIEYQGSRKIILHEKNFVPDFFDLRTKIAGEILQKFVNYRVGLAIIGDFSRFNSNSLNAFILECNRGSNLLFLGDVKVALQKFNGEKMM